MVGFNLLPSVDENLHLVSGKALQQMMVVLKAFP